jgi:DNA topoisomerase-2
MIELESIKGEHGCNGLEKILKLCTSSSTTNMNLFNSEDKLKKYSNVEEIIDDYFDIRLEYYDNRRDYLIENVEQELMVLSNKTKYIQELLNGTIDLRNKKKQEIIDMLIENDYDTIDKDDDFKYLVKMPMDSVSEENIERLNKERANKLSELDVLKSTTIQQMWLSELKMLENEYTEYQKEREKSQLGEIKKQPVNIVRKKVVSNANATKIVKKVTK